ncbi:MAG: hypothetical protein L0I62_01885 [Gammaproteobacteria bacterium]|nr:hypothetical protein [Gammaproteobacteria bacterium]
MNNRNGNNEINIDVTLQPSDSGVRFHYQGADDISRKHVKENGDIDLREPDDLDPGPVHLRFRIGSPEVHLDGAARRPNFAAEESIWMAEYDRDSPVGPFRERGFRGFLVLLRLQRPRFYVLRDSQSDELSLCLFNRDHDDKEYKYTLRIQVSGEAGTRWLEDDPRIRNRPV